MRPSPRSLLSQAGVSALLVSDLSNIRYLTGLHLSAGVLLVTPRAFTLYVDSRYRELAEAKETNTLRIRDMQQLTEDLHGLKECSYEEEEVTVARLRRWKGKSPSTKFVRAGMAVEEFRRQKDATELALMKRADRITEELLRRVPAALRRATTERALAWKLQTWARELGADDLSFPAIVAFGTNTSRPHHQPTSRMLHKGHIVQIDVGVIYKGYCSDRSAVFFTAPLTRLQERVYRAVCEAKEAAIAMIAEGVTTHAVDQAARDVLHTYGFAEHFTHALGHGVGLEVHEGITLSANQPARELLKHEVVTVEPGVYFPGRFGMRVEDMVVVE